jgi:hypothetical protein
VVDNDSRGRARLGGAPHPRSPSTCLRVVLAIATGPRREVAASRASRGQVGVCALLWERTGHRRGAGGSGRAAGGSRKTLSPAAYLHTCFTLVRFLAAGLAIGGMPWRSATLVLAE